MNQLQLKIDEELLDLTVKLGFANYENDQIDPIKKIEDALTRCLKDMEGFTLDLSNFQRSHEFFHLRVLISNKANFEVVCDALERILTTTFQHAQKQITHLMLLNNRIRFLSPLKKLKCCNLIETIDLIGNDIEATEEVENLKHFRLKRLTLGANPVASNENLHETITAIFPLLIFCDIPRKAPPVVLETPRIQQLTTPESIFHYLNDRGGEIVKSCDITEDFKREFREFEQLRNSWSRVVIEHYGKFDSQLIIKELFQRFFNDIPCYPCYYKSGDAEDFFYLHKNFGAIKSLIDNNLRIEMSRGDFVTFRLHLNCAPFDSGQVKYSEVIPSVIFKRKNGTKLNLKNLQEANELKNVMVDMSTVNGLNFIVTCMFQQEINPLHIIDIDLSGNKLRQLDGLEELHKFTNLKSLNLSNNAIDTLACLPKHLKIVELFVSHNPICRQYYRQPYRYVMALKSIYKDLEYLDNYKIDTNFKVASLRNSYCTSQAFNAVENFVNFFFKHFDNERLHLAGIYTLNSIYTERNGCRVVSLNGQQAIMTHITKLPITSHDLVNSTIDVPLFNDDKMQIVINGIVRDDRDKLFTFSRTFIMMKGERAVGTLSDSFYFHIINEICCFSDICDDRIRNKAFKLQAASIDDLKCAYDGLLTTNDVTSANQSLFKQITRLKEKWCLR